MGKVVGVLSAAFKSPILKRMAVEKANVKVPLRIMPATMLRGTTMPAFTTSSPKHICVIPVIPSEGSGIDTYSYGMHNQFLEALSAMSTRVDQHSPVIEYVDVISPIHHETLGLLQPPEFSNV
jgi:hypothetical protein